MNTYKIEQRIKSISKMMMGDGTQPSFSLDGVTVKHENFTLQTGPTGNYWFAESAIDAESWRAALDIFITKVERITARTAFVGQGYTNFLLEPFLITRVNNYRKDVGFFRFTRDGVGMGLVLLEDQRKAIEMLYNNPAIPDDFFLYWNAATNTTDYASKLLLMFGAIEALERNRDKTLFPQKKDLHVKILGENLANDLFAQTTGLRHRLSHGEYFNTAREKRDYLDEVHKAIVTYFNKEILKAELISEDVVAPQRHFDGNKSGFEGFVHTVDNTDLPALKTLLLGFNPDDQTHTIHSNTLVNMSEPTDF